MARGPLRFWSPVAVAAVALALGACGGQEEAQAPPPKLPPALAQELAADADTVAARLDAGDPCGASEQAAALQQRVVEAQNRPGEVPDALREDLGLAVAILVDRAQAECAAAQPPPPPPPATTVDEEDDEGEEENGEGRGKRGKGKGRGKRKD